MTFNDLWGHTSFYEKYALVFIEIWIRWKTPPIIIKLYLLIFRPFLIITFLFLSTTLFLFTTIFFTLYFRQLIFLINILTLVKFYHRDNEVWWPWMTFKVILHFIKNLFVHNDDLNYVLAIGLVFEKLK